MVELFHEPNMRKSKSTLNKFKMLTYFYILIDINEEIDY